MRIAFDDAAADSLVRVANAAATVLRDQGGSRRSVAEEAAADLSGGYSTLFEQACVVEAEDRGRLAGVLEELAQQVEVAKTLAARERVRLKAAAEWQLREDQRKRDRAADPTGALHADSAFTDPKPSEDRVAPPTVSAAFAPRERTRKAGGSSRSGKSSADPVKLRGFVEGSRAMNDRLESEVVATQNAWVGFTGSCSWVPLGTVSFAAGFGRMVTESHADATWIERVAAQFEKAGGGSLSNTALNTAAVSAVFDVADSAAFGRLLDGKLSPAKAAEYWNALGLTAAEVRLLPPEVLLRLASADGLPAWAQDAASREFLAFALKKPEKAYALMGFTPPEYAFGPDGSYVRTGTGLSLGEFTEQLQAMKGALSKAEKDAERLPEYPVIQLLGLGSHDVFLVAGISIGDLDTASNVGVNVSGMFSNAGDMEGGNKAAQELYKSARKTNKAASFAVVNWIGYRSPNIGEVRGMERAEAGGARLAGFLNGINASRQETGIPVTQFNVYAHSYGSTVAVEAVKTIDFDMDSLVTYGSAGVKNGTTMDQLHAGAMYATHASGDNIAKLGQGGPKSLDPLEMEGVTRFSAETSVAADGTVLKGTTMHDMYREEDTWSPINWDGTVGYLSRDSTAVDRMGSLLGTGRLR